MTSHRLPDLQDPSSTTGRFWEASFKEMAAEKKTGATWSLPWGRLKMGKC